MNAAPERRDGLAVDETADKQPAPSPERNRLPSRVRLFRLLGMSLAALPIAAVLVEMDAGGAQWAWFVLSCLAWPHLAYATARRSRDPFGSELRNLVADSVIAGSWVALLHFNALPSALLMIGFAQGSIPSLPLNLALLKGASIVGVFWGEFARREPQRNAQALAELATWYAQGKIRPVIEHQLAMTDLPKAFDLMAARQVRGKLVLTNTA